MKSKLRDDRYCRAIDPTLNMGEAGVYQWSIEGIGVYVGRAKVLRDHLSADPRNVLTMREGRPRHGNPAREYRGIHKALGVAYDAGTSVTVTVLEICDPSVLAERKTVLARHPS